MASGSKVKCSKCQQWLTEQAFARNRAMPSGRQRCRAARSREAHLRRNYGLSSAQRQARLDAQLGVCAICLSVAPEHVDHDHETGKVRGILCFACNAALGQFKDRPDVLRRAADYLEGNLWKPTRLAPGVYRLPS